MKEIIEERIKNMIKNNEKRAEKESNTEGLSGVVRAMHEARVAELEWANRDLEEILKMLGGE